MWRELNDAVRSLKLIYITMFLLDIYSKFILNNFVRDGEILSFILMVGLDVSDHDVRQQLVALFGNIRY